MQLPTHFQTVDELIKARQLAVNAINDTKRELIQIMNTNDEQTLNTTYYGFENIEPLIQLVHRIFSPQEWQAVENQSVKDHHIALNFQETGHVVDYDSTKSEQTLMSAKNNFQITIQFLADLNAGLNPLVNRPHWQVRALLIKDDATYQKELDQLFN